MSPPTLNVLRRRDLPPLCEVFRFKIPKGLGHEQYGGSARQASFRPPVEVEGVPTLVLVEQLGAVGVQRLGKRAGRLGVERCQ